jgi:hypothetical protein
LALCYYWVMTYSQKYCIVSFLEPKVVGDEFDMSQWPLHVTLADVFTIERSSSGIDIKIGQLADKINAFVVTAAQPDKLGETDVILIEKSASLLKLHDDLVNLLESNGAVFNTPEFNRDGFLPHCTIQEFNRLSQGERVEIRSLALIDMFPDSDWTRRRVLQVFQLDAK